MFDMRNKPINPDRWYVEGNIRRVACCHFFVIINELDNRVQMDIYEDGVNVALSLDFLSVDEAVNFTSDIVNNTLELEEIKTEYEKIVKNYEWIKEIENINSKSNEICDFTKKVLDYYKNIEKEYIIASKYIGEVMYDDSKSVKEKENYYKYYSNLKESFERVKLAASSLSDGLNDLTGTVDSEIEQNNTLTNNVKPKGLIKKWINNIKKKRPNK